MRTIIEKTLDQLFAIVFAITIGTIAGTLLKACVKSPVVAYNSTKPYDPYIEWEDNFDSVYYWNDCKFYTTK